MYNLNAGGEGRKYIEEETQSRSIDSKGRLHIWLDCLGFEG